jgi:hypothetical protein
MRNDRQAAAMRAKRNVCPLGFEMVSARLFARPASCYGPSVAGATTEKAWPRCGKWPFSVEAVGPSGFPPLAASHSENGKTRWESLPVGAESAGLRAGRSPHARGHRIRLLRACQYSQPHDNQGCPVFTAQPWIWAHGKGVKVKCSSSRGIVKGHLKYLGGLVYDIRAEPFSPHSG